MDGYIPFVTRKVSLKIPLKDVIYILRKDRKIKIATEQGSYECYEKLQNIEPQLDQRFYHCLKGQIVNFDKVERMEDQTIFLKNGECWIISKNNYIKSKQTFSAYLKKLIQRNDKK